MANTCLNVRDMISGKRNWKEHWRPEMFYFHPVAQYGSNTRFARGAKAFHVAEDWPHIRDIYNLARGEEAQMLPRQCLGCDTEFTVDMECMKRYDKPPSRWHPVARKGEM